MTTPRTGPAPGRGSRAAPASRRRSRAPAPAARPGPYGGRDGGWAPPVRAPTEVRGRRGGATMTSVGHADTSPGARPGPGGPGTP
ncbi:Flagellar hook-length control protein fliK [Streptomyces misionensis JCM 4497]